MSLLKVVLNFKPSLFCLKIYVWNVTFSACAVFWQHCVLVPDLICDLHDVRGSHRQAAQGGSLAQAEEDKLYRRIELANAANY